MKVVQCWDDGVTADIRLTEILRKYNAKASFNLNAGKHGVTPKPEWIFKGTKVERMEWDVMEDVYQGFTIANHSLTHPRLEQLTPEEALKDIVEGRDRLQQFFNQPILGFAYPFGSYNEMVMEALRKAGHVYSRTTKSCDKIYPPENVMEFHPNCHFLADDFFERYERAKKDGVFYFWGHSYEMVYDDMWRDFEELIARISSDNESQWSELPDLF